MANKYLQAAIGSIETVETTRSYWFIRTSSGDYYKEFVRSGFIAVGYDLISPEDIAKNNMYSADGESLLNIVIKQQYPEQKRPAYIGNQLIDFAYKVKKGDLVVIPSYSTGRISIGEVVDDKIYVETDIPDHPSACPFKKRKKVNWIKVSLNFERIDPNLIKIKYRQKTVSRIDPYLGSILDRTITPLFIKGENAHLTFEITKEDSINAFELFESWIELFSLAEEFGKEEGYDVNKKDFNVRINVQSPGTIEFISYSVVGITVLSLLVAAIIGADFKIKNTILGEIHIKTPGLLSQISDFLDKRQERKTKKQLFENVLKMQINPDDVANILKQLNQRNGEKSSEN